MVLFGIMPFLLYLSIAVNITLIWYIIKNLEASEEVKSDMETTLGSLEEFLDHLEELHGLETFYGDQTLKDLIDHSREIINEFVEFYNEFNNPPVYYWCAEKNFWNKVCKYHNIDVDIDWNDMLQIFKSEQIVIKNCFGFGLKEITKNMREFGMINTKLQSECSNGMMAMLKAWKCYGLSNPESSPIMKDIEKYNEFDCKALFDIMNYLRTNMI